MANAKRKADIYATAARAKIGRLMVLTEEPSRAPTVSRPRAYTAPVFAATPIEAGEDKLTVIVTRGLSSPSEGQGAHRKKGRRTGSAALVSADRQPQSHQRGQKSLGVAKNSKTETFRRCRI